LLGVRVTAAAANRGGSEARGGIERPYYLQTKFPASSGLPDPV